MEKFFQSNSGKKIAAIFPNKCPICKNNVSPNKISDLINNDINHVSILFDCPACGKGFISHYNLTSKEKINGSSKYTVIELINSYPGVPENYEFDESIYNISPKFCEIYNQSLKAEFYNLSEISGMGYRKSLEFLIKDYCIEKN